MAIPKVRHGAGVGWSGQFDANSRHRRSRGWKLTVATEGEQDWADGHTWAENIMRSRVIGGESQRGSGKGWRVPTRKVKLNASRKESVEKPTAEGRIVS